MEVNLYFVYLDILFARIKYIGVRKIFCDVHCFGDEVFWQLCMLNLLALTANMEQALLSL